MTSLYYNSDVENGPRANRNVVPSRYQEEPSAKKLRGSNFRPEEPNISPIKKTSLTLLGNVINQSLNLTTSGKPSCEKLT